ncbi:MAG: transcriptional repressor NrdR [Chloroflexi bacterium]|nr:transcriptional repressor NrdR [Chloroflexota bacterium]
MRCPYCVHAESDVVDTRKLDDGSSIRRRRRCPQCGRRFTTYERVETVSITVVKKNGEREPYNREKLMRGILTACYRRPVSAQRIELLTNDIESELLMSSEHEVPSAHIGDVTMRLLRDVDEVAYIRFASVYLSFADIAHLRQAVDELLLRDHTSLLKHRETDESRS